VIEVHSEFYEDCPKGLKTGTNRHPIEWPTFGIITICMVSLPLITFFATSITLWVAVPLLMVVLALHSSLQHEVLHGHPFKSEL